MSAASRTARTIPYPRDFYDRPVLEVARDLLGSVVARTTADGLVRLRLTEVEAYAGEIDPASHAYRGETRRNATMFGPPGHAYVYFIYGMYECLNLVCEPEGRPGCVLVRALEPVDGIDLIRSRRPGARKLEDTASGPGKLTIALGITRAQNGADVTRGNLVVRQSAVQQRVPVETTARVGITKSMDLPLRFYIRGNRFVSKPHGIR